MNGQLWDERMSYVLIIHAVKDYQAWKSIFDAASDMRKTAGEQSYHLLSEEHDSNMIVHFSSWSSLVKARSFFESEQLVEIRRQAGVEEPQFIYLHALEQRTL